MPRTPSNWRRPSSAAWGGGREFVADLDLNFGDQGRSGLQGPLQTLCDAAAEGIQIEARFGKAKEGEA